MIIIQATVYDK